MKGGSEERMKNEMDKMGEVCILRIYKNVQMEWANVVLQHNSESFLIA